jgi:hypothetical protein
MRSALLICLCLASATYGAATTGFEGKWELDKKKTAAKGAPEDLNLEIKNNGNGILIKSKYREPKSGLYPLLWVGVMTYQLELTTDGTEKTNHIGPFTHVSKTTVNGNQMITDFTATLENGKVTGQWTRTLSPDGREMTWQVNTQASDGRKLDQTMVFKRK